MKIKTRYRLLPLMTGMVFITLVLGCADQEPESNGFPGELKVYMSISGYSDPDLATRSLTLASTNNGEQDQWSYRDFTSGDELGFYANTTKGRVSNMAMLFSASINSTGDNSFSFGPADNPDFDPTTIIGSGAYMYFPYTDLMPTESEPELPGLELRAKREPYSDISFENGPWRCIDFLVSEGIDASKLQDMGIITGNMVHSFSELIIMRGEGFDKPRLPEGITDGDPYKITVKLKDSYTHVVINTTANPWKCDVKLVDQSGYKPEGYDKDTDFDASLWEAWKGGNYGQTKENPDGYPAWYVILPTMGDEKSASRSRVEYIQLYDNDGTLQTIKDLYLSGASGYVHHKPGNYLDRKWRYPMQISMQELVPTVFPFTIEEWENGNITNARTRGITRQNLNSFINAYNNFLTNNRPSSADEVLSSYGDKIITSTGGSYWHFYILESLDLSSYTNSVILPQLQDVIDGKSSPAATPVSISGLTVPFIGTMSNNYDSLLNLTVDRPYIDLPQTSSPTGTLVNSLTSGGIENCNINQGYVNVNGDVGMFAGYIINGKIMNSKASGVVVGTNSSSASGYLAGSSGGGTAYTGNNSTVVFSNLNDNDD